MNYEINVAKKNANGEYHHWFATAERSITTESRLVELLRAFKVAFPEPEFSISATRYETIGYGLNIDELLKDKPVGD